MQLSTVGAVRLCVTEVAMELGYPSMKPQQLEVAVALVEGRHIFAVLPRILEKIADTSDF